MGWLKNLFDSRGDSSLTLRMTHAVVMLGAAKHVRSELFRDSSVARLPQNHTGRGQNDTCHCHAERTFALRRAERSI